MVLVSTMASAKVSTRAFTMAVVVVVMGVVVVLGDAAEVEANTIAEAVAKVKGTSCGNNGCSSFRG